MKSRREEIQELSRIFNSTISAYAECRALPLVAAMRYDGQPSHTCRAGTPSNHFALDVELAVRKALTTPEQRDEWDRLVDEAMSTLTAPQVETDPAQTKPKRSPEEQRLTAQVTKLCALQFRRRGLNNVGQYFRTERKRIE